MEICERILNRLPVKSKKVDKKKGEECKDRNERKRMRVPLPVERIDVGKGNEPFYVDGVKQV